MEEAEKGTGMARHHSLTHAILSTRAEGPLDADHYSLCAPDVLMGHDATTALAIGPMRRNGWKPKTPERLFLVADHFAPPSTPERANILRLFLDYCEEIGVRPRVNEGICHQLLAEHPGVVPGSLVAGADSHTVMAGALGAVAVGMGSTDFLIALASGKVFLNAPPCVLVRLRGRLPDWADGKEAVLELLRRHGPDGFIGQSIEFRDEDGGLPMDARLGLCNMGVELGAMNALVIPDGITEAWLRARKPLEGVIAPPPPPSPPDASDIVHAAELTLDLSALAPHLAVPPDLTCIREARDLAGQRVDQVYIGSCASGRMDDLRLAARLLGGKSVHPRTRVLVTPSSRSVYIQALEEGLVTTLTAAGCVVLNPSCGACGGIDKGLLGDGETAVTTTNRNYPGRMGSGKSRLFLAGAATAAAAAVTGVIADPREVFP
ncbi:MAG: Homoaconitase large subunit [Myxococcota bacterium]|nr:Homoaconitase large subunit [Myxococcota bacterium]